jgi:cobalamin biosynthesis Co2+ chelatase CbiK
MKKQNIILIVLILFSTAGNIFLSSKYFNAKKELDQVRTTLKSQQKNENILVFTRLFIEKVLKATGEVDFETRLQLENSVRNLGDQEILNQWQKFTNAQTQEDAQREVKNLLGLLVGKIE